VVTVYHYTDTQAFKGVIENAALWATDFRYLNDSGELIYTWAAFVERLEKLVKNPGGHAQAYAAQLEALTLLNARDLMQFDDAMFVACFTELPTKSPSGRATGTKGAAWRWGLTPNALERLRFPSITTA